MHCIIQIKYQIYNQLKGHRKSSLFLLKTKNIKVSFPHFSHPNEPNTREDQSGWECNLCTFRNKVRQRECEACAMPFLSAGNAMGYNGSYMQSSPPSYPLTQYVPMPMHSLPYQQQNNMPLHYLMYQPASLQPMQQSQSSIVPNPQYFNGFQTMAAYQNP